MGEIASPAQLRQGQLRWVAVCVPLVLLLGTLSGVLSGSRYDQAWFAALRKPAIVPPGWVFGLTWTVLYILIGVALALIVYARGAPARQAAIGLFVLQLALNLAWAPIFFGGHHIALAWLWSAAILVAALATTFAFGRVRTVAAWLMVPYLAWLCFATLMGYDIARMNPNGVAPAASREVRI